MKRPTKKPEVPNLIPTGTENSKEVKAERLKAKGKNTTPFDPVKNSSAPHIDVRHSETAKSEIENKSDPGNHLDEDPKRRSSLEHLKETTNSEKSEVKEEPLTSHNSPLTAMEVHHHPEVEKKGLKEYILEGLMIFIAVMMGFFAESLREHLVDRDRETQYMQEMVVDLRKDAVTINAEIVYVNQVISNLDSLFRCIHTPKLTDSVQRRLYQLYLKSNLLVGIEFSDAASVQLKSTGGLRLIQSQKVADAIIHYWQASEVMKFDGSVFNGNAENFWGEALKIFDLYNLKSVTQPQAAGSQIEPDARLLTLDRLQLTEYANRAASLILMLRMHYLPSVLKQKVIESDLDKLINKNYKF